MTAFLLLAFVVLVFFVAPTARAAADRYGRRRRELARVPRIDVCPRVPPPPLRRADPSPRPLGDYDYRAWAEGEMQR